jgi:putative transcriptional regulator
MDSLRNHFLIAMPHLKGDIFADSLTYICEHNEDGALGIIINKTLPIKLSEILSELDILANASSEDINVMAGGPVSTGQGFILHSDNEFPDASLRTGPGIYLTTSKDVLSAISEDKGPLEFLVSLGYAGWDAGQLEDELANNFWLTCPADADIIFKTPVKDRLAVATQSLGISLDQISSEAGHA